MGRYGEVTKNHHARHQQLLFPCFDFMPWPLNAYHCLTYVIALVLVLPALVIEGVVVQEYDDDVSGLDQQQQHILTLLHTYIHTYSPSIYTYRPNKHAATTPQACRQQPPPPSS